MNEQTQREMEEFSQCVFVGIKGLVSLAAQHIEPAAMRELAEYIGEGRARTLVRLEEQKLRQRGGSEAERCGDIYREQKENGL
jgi:hypothetical protein